MMKNRMKMLWATALFSLSALASVQAQSNTFDLLHAFSANPNGNNSDGASPYAGLVQSGNTLYGTAENGGTNGYGTVFALNTSGGGFVDLHSFDFTDGSIPQSKLV